MYWRLYTIKFIIKPLLKRPYIQTEFIGVKKTLKHKLKGEIKKMEIKKEFNRDILYKIKLISINGFMDYCLVDANNDKEIYCIFEEEPIKE